ncbi:MAG TPA: cation diffusion facilitator family transporter [Acetobacteraceae bacterium]|jgi:cobalt-zinc-cadmium efflux system protein|nr:cation diffusion facilitator family transporter [Acetobacteraceae bacterium]
MSRNNFVSPLARSLGIIAPAMAHHQHDRGHHHSPHGHDRAFAIGTALNLGFVVAEIGFGLLANSMALLADAAHNFGDVLGLLLGWGAAWLARRPPTRRRTYGWGRSSILAALLNATILLIGVGAIGVEAVHRLLAPEPVREGTVILVAAAGILINGATALLFLQGRGHDINVRAQFVHMAADAGVSAGVVLAGLLILLTGWGWLDPAASLAIGVVIVATTWGLLRESIDLAMDAVPGGVAQEAVQDYLASVPGVLEVHDLHIWGLSTTQTALTAHLVCADPSAERTLHDVTTELRDRFGIGHATLQIENDTDAELCRLRPHDVV